MENLSAKTELIAKCGLFCGECPKFIKGKCKGCEENIKATWCKIRKCCIEKNIQTCANCLEYENTKDCAKTKGFINDTFSFIFNSDRHACVVYIKEKGAESFVQTMTENKWVTMPLRGKKKKIRF